MSGFGRRRSCRERWPRRAACSSVGRCRRCSARPRRRTRGRRCSGRWPTCGTARSACTCREGSAYRSFHDTDTCCRRRRRHRSSRRSSSTTAPSCPAATTAWAPSRGRTATSGWSATTRSTGPVAAAFGPGAPYDSRTGGGTTTIEVTARRPGRPGVHQPQRHPDELLRRAHAVGQLDHLRGDGQRPRRRPRLHRRVQRHPAAAPRVHLRGAGGRAVQPAADHLRRSLRPRGRGLQPATRASCTSPRTTSPSRRASTATSRRRTR